MATMEYLEKLLNEYEASKQYVRYTWELQTYKDDHTKKVKQWFNVSIFNKLVCHEDAEPIIFSKSYKFIEWLLKQDYIQIGKIKRLYRKSDERSIETYPVMYEYSDYECLLMLLSIQDEPIQFLTSLLK